MDSYEATFVIDSKTDAYAVERVMERLYNALREESRSVRDGSNDSSAVLEEFAAIRDATHERSSGTLTVRYEQSDDGFGP